MENFQNYAFVIDKPNQPKPGFTKPLVIKKSADRQSEKSDIKFFIDPILKHASFLQNDDGSQWSLTFFQNTRFEKTLLVSCQNEATEPSFCVAKAAHLTSSANLETTPEELIKVSQFTRSSNSLQATDITNLKSDACLITDRKALVFQTKESKEYSEDRFKRVVVALCLALAYRR